MRSWVKARIDWSPPQGGRIPPGPVYSTPARFERHRDRWPDEAWSIVAEFAGPVGADGSVPVRLRFLAEEAPQELLVPGSKFDLFEGDVLVGSGIVLAGVGCGVVGQADSRSSEVQPGLLRSNCPRQRAAPAAKRWRRTAPARAAAPGPRRGWERAASWAPPPAPPLLASGGVCRILRGQWSPVPRAASRPGARCLGWTARAVLAEVDLEVCLVEHEFPRPGMSSADRAW